MKVRGVSDCIRNQWSNEMRPYRGNTWKLWSNAKNWDEIFEIEQDFEVSILWEIEITTNHRKMAVANSIFEIESSSFVWSSIFDR